MDTQIPNANDQGSQADRLSVQAKQVSVSLKGTFERCIPFYDLAPQETIEIILNHTLRLLDEIGIEFRDEHALATWRDAGARVDGAVVRIPPELLMDCVALAPPEFVQHARNPERSVKVGGMNMVFMQGFGSTFVRDLEGKRRPSTLSDFHDLVKLAYMLPSLNYSGGVVCEPMDVPVETRHLDMIYSHFRYSDKPFMGNPSTSEIARDCVEMCKIIFGADFVESNVVMTVPINCNSPRVWAGPVLEVLRVYALNNQAVSISPFVLQGASTPITSAGALVQLNAEVLAGIAYMQLVRAGSASIYGINGTIVSMKTGHPLQPSAEAQLISCIATQLTRHFRVPMRMLGFTNDANELDIQAGYESIQNIYPSLLAGGHFFTHCAGWLEAAMSTCFAKFIMDAEQLMIIQRFLKGIEVTGETLAWEAFEEVPPAGNYFICEHTLRYFRDAFYTPDTKISEPYEIWLEKGAENVVARARNVARKILENYEPPPVDEGIDEALKDYIKRRKAEIKKKTP